MADNGNGPNGPLAPLIGPILIGLVLTCFRSVMALLTRLAERWMTRRADNEAPQGRGTVETDSGSLESCTNEAKRERTGKLRIVSPAPSSNDVVRLVTPHRSNPMSDGRLAQLYDDLELLKSVIESNDEVDRALLTRILDRGLATLEESDAEVAEKARKDRA